MLYPYRLLAALAASTWTRQPFRRTFPTGSRLLSSQSAFTLCTGCAHTDFISSYKHCVLRKPEIPLCYGFVRRHKPYVSLRISTYLRAVCITNIWIIQNEFFAAAPVRNKVTISHHTFHIFYFYNATIWDGVLYSLCNENIIYR